MPESKARALKWIVDILNRHAIRYLVSGGMAASMYGSRRAVRDIDIDIEACEFSEIEKDLRPYFVCEPRWHKSRAFWNYLLTLRYAGEVIDIAAGENAKYFDPSSGTWRHDATDFADFQTRKLDGQTVRIVSPGALIAYKQRFPRAEDLEDIAAVRRWLPVGDSDQRSESGMLA
jgi:hypothetical protein